MATTFFGQKCCNVGRGACLFESKLHVLIILLSDGSKCTGATASKLHAYESWFYTGTNRKEGTNSTMKTTCTNC